MLTVAECKNAKASARPRKLYDEKGLYLLVMPTGTRGWRFKYTFGGREKGLSFGAFPEVTLAEARDARDSARKLLRDHIDPSADRQAKKLKSAMPSASTFESVAREWLDEKHAKKVGADTAAKAKRRLERHVFPEIGRRPVAEITAAELLTVLEHIQRRGKLETAHRARSLCGRIWRYAITKRLVAHDVAADLKGALVPAPTNSFAAVTEPKKVGVLLRAIDAYDGHLVTRSALQVLALTFVRPGELRLARWGEFDLDATVQVGKKREPAPMWRIPGERMKGREPHLVALSNQAAAILRELRKLTGHVDDEAAQFVFPSLRPGRPLSENTLNMALRSMGYDGETHTAHGFRSMASTRLHELGFPAEVVELQLAHQIANPVARVYNRSARLEERRRMLQSWADHLDSLRRPDDNVTAIRRRRRG